MKRSYLDYAMSVIVARAIPDVRDGLKPVHRRILYAMKVGGFTSDRPFRKSARIVGDVMGKFHPHGNMPIYDALVRMAQSFSMRLPLIEGQGNFGSMDGDPPAADRYTEARLAPAAETMLDDIERDTVDFQANYDGAEQEPVVLPAMFPNLLVNGANGIAVGMATNIPPHNLGEVIDACCAYIDRPEIPLEELMEHLPGPDFPTGAIILGRSGIYDAFRTGRGSLVVRARHKIEELRKERQAIVFTEIPYQVNKQKLVERIAELVNEKTIEGIAELRDESDRDGVRIVAELKRDADAEVTLNQLFRFTPLQTSFGVIMLSLNGGRPEVMPLKPMIEAFVAFREQVVTRRTLFELKKARDRAHILAGLAVAVVNVDAVVALVRRAPDPAAARQQLMATPWPAADVAPFIELIAEPGRRVADGVYYLSEEQAKAILDLRLQRLTGLEREKIVAELQQIVEQIRDFLGILASRERVLAIIRDEFQKMKADFGAPRATEIGESEIEQDIEDLIQREDMVLTITHQGYVKRVPLSTYRAQRRGGKGRTGMTRKEEDVVSQVYAVDTHTPVLFFSSLGLVYKLKVYRLPLGTPQSRGRAFRNLLPLRESENISIVLPLPEEDRWANLDIMLATASGGVRRNSLADFVNVKQSGKIAMKLDAGDRLVGAQVCNEGQDILLAARNGKCIRFEVGDVRVFAGRTSTGVRGISLGDGDRVISMSMLRHTDFTPEERRAYLRRVAAERHVEEVEPQAAEEPGAEEGNGEPGRPLPQISDERYAEMQKVEDFILSVAEDGFGKLTSAYEYRITNRGGKGIENIVLERGGAGTSLTCIAAFPATKDDQLLLVTEQGQIIRTKVEGIRTAGRRTRGVKVFSVDEGDRVVSVSRLEMED